MIPEPLVRGLLSALLLLEGSDDTEVDPDVAVAGMESMAHELSQLDQGDLEELIDTITRIADAETDPALSALYRSTPRILGLVI